MKWAKPAIDVIEISNGFCSLVCTLGYRGPYPTAGFTRSELSQSHCSCHCLFLAVLRQSALHVCFVDRVRVYDTDALELRLTWSNQKITATIFNDEKPSSSSSFIPMNPIRYKKSIRLTKRREHHSIETRREIPPVIKSCGWHDNQRCMSFIVETNTVHMVVLRDEESGERA